MSANLENSTEDWKRSVFIPIPKKGNSKEYLNYHTVALISHASKVMLKILQASLQQYMNCELRDVQAGFRKGRQIRHQISTGSYIYCLRKKKKLTQKTQKVTNIFIVLYAFQSIYQLSHFLKKIVNALLH